ncbi:ubiquitin carboxyl-terminal hydrolase [Geranomyces variabilis]|uniref:ubiquitinyl hydrolase 1 n=1 Tax=Geranomyces variabilis TaxID=109894 RepID=A0AAD5TDS9_9FUNG|nr:ubiquitin carboxyl-terminal hydrolase [Geranomyces variabilis]
MVPPSSSPVAPNPSPSSRSIPIPTTARSLKRPANEAALSPESPKLSPHVPRTPTSRGFQEFGVNHDRSGVGRRQGKENDMVMDAVSAVDGSGERNGKRPSPGHGCCESETPPAYQLHAGQQISTGESAVNQGVTPTASLTEPYHAQEPLRRKVQACAKIKEEGRYYLVDCNWLRAWNQYVTDGVVHPGPIKTANLIEPGPVGDLRSDLKEGTDFAVVPEADWRRLVEIYGLAAEHSEIPRPTYWDPATEKWRLEVYLPAFECHAVEGPTDIGNATLSFSRGHSLRRVHDKICFYFEVEGRDFQLYVVNRNGERTRQDDGDKTLVELNLEHMARLMVVRREEEAKPASEVATNLENVPQQDDVPAEPIPDTTAEAERKRAKRERVLRKQKGEYESDDEADLPSTAQLMLQAPTPSEDEPVIRKNVGGAIAASRSGSAYRNELPIGATGLSNLGNTCFMNSALQCLSNTPPLTKYFLKEQWKAELNPENPLGMKGQVAAAYAELITQLWRPDDARNASYAPRPFKSTIGKFNSMFAGYSQQDSQELLGFLVDGLHEDLNRIKQKPYIEAPNMDGKPDAEIAAKAWEIYCMRNDSVIVDLFQGQYKSRVECIQCGQLSVTFDPYMFLSVPIPDHREICLKVFAVSKAAPSETAEPPRQLWVTLQRDSHADALIKLVAKRMGWPSKPEMVHVMFEQHENRVFKIFEADDPVSSIVETDDIWIIEACEPDWDLFNTPPELRKPDNVSYHPVMYEIRQAHRAPPLVPLMITLPKDNLGRPPPYNLQSESTARDRAAVRVYRVIAQAFRRFARHPLFSTDPDLRNVVSIYRECVEIKRRLSDSSHLSRYCDLDEQTAADELEADALSEMPLSWNDIGPTCQPIADMFAVECYYYHDVHDLKDYYTRGWMDPRRAQCTFYDHETFMTEEDGLVLPDEVPPASEDDNMEVLRHSGSDPTSPASSPTPPDQEDDDELPDVSYTSTRNRRRSQERDYRENLTSFQLPAGAVFTMNWFNVRYFNHLADDPRNFRAPDACDKESMRVKDAFLAKQHAPKQKLTLQDCLDEYRKEEMLGDDNNWYCPNCKEHRPTKKKLDIWTVPEILVFHLKRFSSAGRGYGYRSMMGDKIDSFVDAPIHGLDLTDVVVGKHPARKWHSQNSVRSAGTAVSAQGADNMDGADAAAPEGAVQSSDVLAGSPSDFMSVDDHETTSEHELNGTDSRDGVEDDSLVYDLFAVSNHFGGLGGGHYTAYAKNCLDDEWYNFDDSNVSKTDESSIMTPAAYFLFYRRRSKHSNTDLVAVLEQIKLQMAEKAAADAAAALLHPTLTATLKNSTSFLSVGPSGPLRSQPATLSSRLSGLASASPNGTSADTTQNNSFNASPTGSGMASDDEMDTAGSGREGRRAGPANFGPSLPQERPSMFGSASAGWDFGGWTPSEQAPHSPEWGAVDLGPGYDNEELTDVVDIPPPVDSEVHELPDFQDEEPDAGPARAQARPSPEPPFSFELETSSGQAQPPSSPSEYRRDSFLLPTRSDVARGVSMISLDANTTTPPSSVTELPPSAMQPRLPPSPATTSPEGET